MSTFNKFIRRRLNVIAISIVFIGAVNANSWCQQPSTSTLTITNEQASPQESRRQRESTIDEVVSFIGPVVERQLISQVIQKMRPLLSPQDRTLEETLIVSIQYAETPNAFAYLEKDGSKHIVFTSGLYTYLEDLVSAEVLSRKYNATECGNAYTSYLIKSVKLNASFDSAHIFAPVETFVPMVFAAKHPEICPKLSIEQSALDKGDIWHDQYQDAMHLSFLFVMLHEFAHIKNDDISHRLTSSPADLEVARLREAAADNFALDFLVQYKASPLAALPVMSLIAGLQDYSIEVGASDHPATLERTKAMYNASLKVIKSRRFKRWVKAQGPDSVHSSKEFLTMLNQALN